MNKIAIIIPCYNEEKRLNKQKILELSGEQDVTVFLANDGSTDSTLRILEAIALENPKKISVLHFEKNLGKAGVIFKAINQVLMQEKYDYIGYFDADFSTPLQELFRMISELKNSNFEFIFGSRVKLLNSKINRKISRHYIGRIIITLINVKFKLAIYDTQCGAKIFSKKMVESAFNVPFYTSWLFDVEVFIRLRKKKLLVNGKEFPLHEWIDVEGSKLNWKHGIKIFREIFKLYKSYK